MAEEISDYTARMERRKAAAKAAQQNLDAVEPRKWVVTVVRGGLQVKRRLKSVL